MQRKLNPDEDNAIRILDYWFAMEFLNQQNTKWLDDHENKVIKYKKALAEGKVNRQKDKKKLVNDVVRFKMGDSLRVITKTDSEIMGLPKWSNFTVFIGRMKKEACIQKIAKNVKWNGQSPDENNDRIAIAALKFSQDGIYIPNSLSISPLVWATKKLSGGISNVSQKLSISEYSSDIGAAEEKILSLLESLEEEEDEDLELGDLSPISDIVSYDLLKKIEEVILCELNITRSEIEPFFAVYFKLYELEKDAEENEDNAGLHMDFYSEDLAYATEALRNNRFTDEKKKLLLDYILGLNRYGMDSENKPNRFDLVNPKRSSDLYKFMSNTLTATKAPLGKWPSKYMPVLMQQIAINLATNKDRAMPIFSVNGPPGTGKTTLLREIIASNIIEKAILLANYNDPDNAFDDYSFAYGPGPGHSYNQYVKKYHRLKKKEINAYSILIASSNNTAVENITKELPLEGKLLRDITPSESADGPNDAALIELTELFTVSESMDTIPYVVQKEYTNESGEKKQRNVIEDKPDIYFSQLATDLLNKGSGNQKNQQAFGLIAATLGKKPNIDLVEKNVILPLLGIMRKNDGITQRKQNYLYVRERFLKQLALVQNLRVKQDSLLAQYKKYSDIRERNEKIKNSAEEQRKKVALQISEIDSAVMTHQKIAVQLSDAMEDIKNRIKSISVICSELSAKIKWQTDCITAIQTRTNTLENSVSGFGKLFKSTKYQETQKQIAIESAKKTYYQQKIKAFNINLNKENENLIFARKKEKELLVKLDSENKKLKELLTRKKILEEENKKLKEDIDLAKEQTGKQEKLFKEECEAFQNRNQYERGDILTPRFIRHDLLSEDIDISTKAQLRNPWISEHYNREREKLFLYALQLTKEFILSSNKCRDNFKHLSCLWSGAYGGGERVKFIDEDLQNVTAAAYETLFLLIPVVSSTFASVQRLFKDTREEDVVGTLIVDEAGQASPHMAIGALCRARRAIIVGDPKQVEPVVTDDQDLLKQTYTEDIYRLYADKTNSVQRFADIINPYGTYLENNQGVDEWVGCPLLVHRRCISPMYDISNDISYNNIMKQQTAPPKEEALKTFISAQSQWINVNGREDGKKKHFVNKQGDKVIEMLEIAFSKKLSPDIFIISPFTSVVEGIKKYIKSYVNECRNEGVESALVSCEDYCGSLSNWLNTNIGTVHRFQGKEAAEVIFLLGCDTSVNAAPAIQWVNNNIVNVAVTRAKYRLYVIGDIEAWKQSRCVSRAKEIIDTYALKALDQELQKENPDKEKLKSLCQQIPTGTSFPVNHKQGESEEEEEYVPSTTQVIEELDNANIMARELSSDELSRFGFNSMDDIKKFSPGIQSNLLWGMKLYLLLENSYKQTNMEADASSCGILFCKAIEMQMQECFVDALKRYFPDYPMRTIPASAAHDEQIIYLKDAEPDEFTLGWYPAFMKKNKGNLGNIMSQIGYPAYTGQWWDDFKSKLFECKNRRNDCCHTRLFPWENLEVLLGTMFSTTESKHHNQLKGLMFESKVGLLMKNASDSN